MKFTQGCKFRTTALIDSWCFQICIYAMVTCRYALITCFLMMEPWTLQMWTCCGSFESAAFSLPLKFAKTAALIRRMPDDALSFTRQRGIRCLARCILLPLLHWPSAHENKQEDHFCLCRTLTAVLSLMCTPWSIWPMVSYPPVMCTIN